MGGGLAYIRVFVSKDFLMSTPYKEVENVGA